MFLFPIELLSLLVMDTEGQGDTLKEQVIDCVYCLVNPVTGLLVVKNVNNLNEINYIFKLII